MPLTMYYTIIIIISIVILLIWMYSNNITEKFTSNDPIIDIISNYFKNTKTDYKSYVDLLLQQKNTNMTIVTLDTYYQFKTLQNLGLLSNDKIAMKLI
jgi:hypothetical protein